MKMIKKEMKKALSDVVATVLIILLTVSAVSVLISFLIPFIEKNLASSTDCLPYKDYYQFEESVDEISYNCYQIGGGQVLIGATIKSGSGLAESEMERLDGLLLVFSSGSNVEAVNLTDGKAINKNRYGIREFNGGLNLETKKENEIRTYVYNTTSSFLKTEIHPILKSGKICEVSDSINLKSCAGALLNG